MGVQNWNKPKTYEQGKRHFAYTPIIFTANMEGEIEEASLQVYAGWETERVLLATLTATSINYQAKIDIAPICRAQFTQDIPDRRSAVIEDSNLSQRFSVKLGDTFYQYVVQNAVSQVGADGEKDLETQVTQDGRDMYYFTIPDGEGGNVQVISEVSVISDDDSRKIEIDGVEYTLEAGKTYRIRMIHQEDADAIYALTGTHLRIVDASDCDSPAMVRWVNRKGGVEYFCFHRRQYKVKTAQTKALREVYMENPKNYHTNRMATGVEGSRSVRMGANGLTREEHDLLTKMPYSPCIQWYDIANEVWEGVTVKSFSNTEDTMLMSYDFEIELKCPAIRMQFD